MSEPYDVTRPADHARGIRRYVDRTGREWTEPDEGSVIESRAEIERSLVVIGELIEDRSKLRERAETAERERDAYEAWATEYTQGSWRLRHDDLLPGTYPDRSKAVAALRARLGLSESKDERVTKYIEKIRAEQAAWMKWLYRGK
jgi:hypothetical protein